MQQPLWTPSEQAVANSNIRRFSDQCEQQYGIQLPDYDSLWQWSVDQPEVFWTSFWDFAGIISETRGERVLINPEKMLGAEFFPDAKLNFAENLLQRRDDTDAIVFRAENKAAYRLSWQQLHDRVSVLSQALRDAGVQPGDRVAGFVPNMPETIVAMLASSAIGAIWTSCSPDFGVNGVLDRFGQSRPKVLFCADGYYYNGKGHDSLATIKEILAELPMVEQLVVMPLLSDTPDVSKISIASTVADFTAAYQPGEIEFTRMPFNHPLFIMYSSGTTGKPKCITHSAGGMLLNLRKEHLLNCDQRPEDKVFYFTTCGWMMWNWLVGALGTGATVMLYDGSPFYPDGNVLYDYAEQEAFTLFGTSAKYIDACRKAGLQPAATHNLSQLRTICSTGSPLVDEGFDYIYESVKQDVQLSSISGGTDICGCFILGNPTGPVWRGEIQARGLGLAIEVFDDQGNPVRGERGELVCTKPFPNMPVSFWGDESGEKYQSAYFDKYPDIWTHGDFIEITAHNGVVVYGRSDATLNPGGVRIGTAEIYRQVELFDEIQEAIVIGQEWDADTRVVLFVRMTAGTELDDSLIKAIKTRIRSECTPRHVPAKIIPVADIPRTRSGKITELAVRDVVHGREVKNQEALANPEALQLFADIPALQED